jgi:hypothetical protein
MAAFARRGGIEYSTFAGWVPKAARKRPAAKRPRFAEVRLGSVLVAAPPAGLLEVRLRAALMLVFPYSVRMFVAVTPVDMRTRLMLLYWDGTGVWGPAKRLEQGRLSWPQPSQAGAKLSLAPEALALLIGGIELKHGSLKAWYER